MPATNARKSLESLKVECQDNALPSMDLQYSLKYFAIVIIRLFAGWGFNFYYFISGKAKTEHQMCVLID